jgi:hypothetical protein
MTSETPSTAQDCVCLAVRQAARHVTQFYDRMLAASGLRTTQFSLLARLRRQGPIDDQCPRSRHGHGPHDARKEYPAARARRVDPDRNGPVRSAHQGAAFDATGRQSPPPCGYRDSRSGEFFIAPARRADGCFRRFESRGAGRIAGLKRFATRRLDLGLIPGRPRIRTCYFRVIRGPSGQEGGRPPMNVGLVPSPVDRDLAAGRGQQPDLPTSRALVRLSYDLAALGSASRVAQDPLAPEIAAPPLDIIDKSN